MGIRNVAFYITAINTNVIVKCGNGSQADGDRIARKRPALGEYIRSRIYLFGATFGTFIIFHVTPPVWGQPELIVLMQPPCVAWGPKLKCSRYAVSFCFSCYAG